MTKNETDIVAVPGTSQIVITREFAAPRDLVYRAFTEPELLAQWLGPRELTLKIDTWEMRDGGRWRYLGIAGDGSEFGFHGVFHGTPTPDGIVQTFEFEGTPGHISLDAVTFTERGGRTLVRTVSSFQSVEDRDGMVESGMEHGIVDGYSRLDELLAALAAR